MATATVKTCEVIGRALLGFISTTNNRFSDEEKLPLKFIATGMHDCTFLVLTKH